MTAQSPEKAKREITKQKEVKLPEKVPDGWLEDIKNAVQENKKKLILTTVLSSSLITGILSTIGNYQASLYLENQKSSLQLKGKKAEKVFQAYETLSKEINELERFLQSTSLSLQLAPSEKDVEDSLGSTIQDLVKQRQVMEKSLRDNWIEEDTRQMIKNTFEPLGGKIQAVQNSLSLEKNQRDTKTFKSLEDLCETLIKENEENLISPIKKHINEKMKSIDPNNL